MLQHVADNADRDMFKGTMTKRSFTPLQRQTNNTKHAEQDNTNVEHGPSWNFKSVSFIEMISPTAVELPPCYGYSGLISFLEVRPPLKYSYSFYEGHLA